MELYIHVPFCRKKCKYCDFLSWDNKWDCMEKYFRALQEDIKREGELCSEKIKTIYIGGGTPGLPDARYIYDIMQCVKQSFDIDKKAEITIETNPCTVTGEKAEAYLRAGINRVSMGIQSFDDNELKILGRAHNAADAERAFYLLRTAGFKNINIDLIQSLPGQTTKIFLENLKHAVELSPEHISAYELIIEEGTPFWELYGPESGFHFSEDTEVDIYEETVSFLEKSGYSQYEISNYAKKGFESAHNIGYWTGEPYIGCGTGAVGYRGNIRKKKLTDIKAYIDNPHEFYTEKISEEEKKAEFIFLGMRMKKGISVLEYEKRFGEEFPKKYRDIFKLYMPEFVNFTNGMYSFTSKGFLVSNTILSEFIDYL